MDLERIGALFHADGPETPAPTPGAAQGKAASGGFGNHPAGAPGASPEAPGDAPPGWRGFTLFELQAAAGEDWPEVAGRPEALGALALLLEASAKRAAGERPAHYTQAALCETCGPVWLWAGAPARVLACPWCLSPPAAPVPRPTREDGLSNG